MPPVWVEAMDLRVEIDDAVRAWQPDGASTPDRLRGLAARRWRPQDTRSVEQIAANLESWAAPIKALLSPQHVKHVSSPCPAARLCRSPRRGRRDGADAGTADRRRHRLHLPGDAEPIGHQIGICGYAKCLGSSFPPEFWSRTNSDKGPGDGWL